MNMLVALNAIALFKWFIPIINAIHHHHMYISGLGKLAQYHINALFTIILVRINECF